MEQIGAPFDFDQVRGAFGSSAAAADFLGLRRGTPEANRSRSTFQRSWQRWGRGDRRPSGGWWDRLRSGAQRATILSRVRARGLIVESWDGTVDVYGSDVRDRSINEEVYLTPEELDDANGYSFFRGVARNDWTEAARAVSTAWFSSYVGNDLAGGDATWGAGDLIVRIP